MSSIENLTRQLRALPFCDMMQVAEELRERLMAQAPQDGFVQPVNLAKILSQLSTTDISLSEGTQADEKVLKRIFSRKRTFSISRQGTAGWDMFCSTLPGSNVLGTELRPMFGLMLDQIITFHELGKK
jgi:hypothetical protein